MQRSQRSPLKSLIRDATHLGSGTAAAQLIIIVSAPVMTRLYDPAILGTFNAFISIAALLTAVSALTYPMAIVIAREHNEAKALSAISLAAITCTSLSVAIAVWIAGDHFIAATKLETLSGYLGFIPILMVLGGCHAIADFWASRTMQFRLKARCSVISAANTVLLKIGAGFVYPSPTVLILANLIGIITALLLTLTGLKASQPAARPDHAVDLPMIRQAALQHLDFPLYRAPQIGINNLSSALPIVILASIFGTPSAAYFGLAMSTLGAPSKLIASSVGNALYPRIANSVQTNPAEAFKLVKSSTFILALAGSPFLILMLISAPSIFALIFGPQWDKAGVYAQILSPMLLLYFVNKPAVAAIPTLRLQRGLLIYELLTTGTKITVLYFGFHIFNDELTTIALFSATGTIAYVILIAWVFRELSKHARMQYHDVNASG